MTKKDIDKIYDLLRAIECTAETAIDYNNDGNTKTVYNLLFGIKTLAERQADKLEGLF